MGCNGCTDCCKAVGLNKMSPAREKALKIDNSIPNGWVRISKRIAKKRNPSMFEGVGWGSNKTYFKCTHLTDNGCSIHKESPYVCSGYPYYGRSLEENQSYANAAKFEYSGEGCNLWQELSELSGEREYDKWVLSNFSNYVDNFKDKLHKNRSEFSDRLIPTINL